MKIDIDRENGPVVFLGTMNAMPMMYALELKKQGVDVIYFVDVGKEDTLCRPENHFPEIEYPYPDWVVELKLPSQILVSIFRQHYAKKIKNIVRLKTDKEPQLYMLNGFFISLTDYFKDHSGVVCLSHGSDLDTWADIDGVHELTKSFGNSSIFKYLPRLITKKLIAVIVKRQYRGFVNADAVLYFPKGFNSKGDRVIDSIEHEGGSYYPRYDVSFRPLASSSRSFKRSGEKLILFSGVRFNYETFSEGNDGYNKGNDIIIKGLAKYYRKNGQIEVHFVQKGADVKNAMQLCDSLGLSDVVVWHKEMKFLELLSLYYESDICFDQCGSHWVAAIGFYALYLGKPLIANDVTAISSGLWDENSPIQSASSPEEVCAALEKLSDERYREKISSESKGFAEDYLSPASVLNNLFFLK